jgi:hypothetical protein
MGRSWFIPEVSPLTMPWRLWRASVWLMALAGFACLTCWSCWSNGRFRPTDSPGEGRLAVSDRRPLATPPDAGPAASLAERCQTRAARLSRQLGYPCQSVVRPPFALAGDLSAAELQDKWQGVIQPACNVLLARYFRQLPQRPVLLLMFRSEAAYRAAAEQLFFDRNVSRFGYYKPGRQTVLVNLGAGDGPLLHELTHVLMDADFPNAPPWLQEGLATLYEACEFRAVGERKGTDVKANTALEKPDSGLGTSADQPPAGRLIPVANWRIAIVQQALRNDRLPPLRQWLETASFGGPSEARDYAYARYLCWFLQERDVLEWHYDTLRKQTAAATRDRQTLLDLGIASDWDSLEREFHAWLGTLENLGEDPHPERGSRQAGPEPNGAFKAPGQRPMRTVPLPRSG